MAFRRVFEWTTGMAEENHEPRNTIRLDGIPPRSRVLDAIPLNVALPGFPRWIRTRRRTIDMSS